jgi:hypothetical protein
MGCFTCGKGFPIGLTGALKHFKKMYELYGVERYFFKTGENKPVLVCSKAAFKEIYKKQIKPNLKHGAEYSHIKEYNPNS